MMNALGESSLGVSNLQPFQGDKTATEVKALQVQRNARDNYNQLMLAEAMKRHLMLWHTMNQILLFSDPNKQAYIIRVVGKDAIAFFQKRGFDDMKLPNESAQHMVNMSDSYGNDMKKMDQAGLGMNQFMVPSHPVTIGSGENKKIVPKLSTEENGGGSLYVEPEDIKGQFDFSIDVESMTVTADEERKQARQTAVSLLVSNPNIIALLQQEGVKPKFKDLFVTWLEDLGFNDAQKFFEATEQPGAQPGMGGGSPQDQMAQMAKMFGGEQGGQPGQSQTNPGTGANQMSKIISPEQQTQNQPTIGQPNQNEYKRLINKFAGGNQNGGQSNG
jgi:hypothetical protein